MTKIRTAEVNFKEIFEFAENEYQVVLKESEIFGNKYRKEFDILGLEQNIEDAAFSCDEIESGLPYNDEILLNFLKKNELDEMRVSRN